jgi:hypothetical protein
VAEKYRSVPNYVPNGATTLADQMLVALHGVRVVTLGPHIERDLTDLAEFG